MIVSNVVTTLWMNNKMHFMIYLTYIMVATAWLDVLWRCIINIQTSNMRSIMLSFSTDLQDTFSYLWMYSICFTASWWCRAALMEKFSVAILLQVGKPKWPYYVGHTHSILQPRRGGSNLVCRPQTPKTPRVGQTRITGKEMQRVVTHMCVGPVQALPGKLSSPSLTGKVMQSRQSKQSHSNMNSILSSMTKTSNTVCEYTWRQHTTRNLYTHVGIMIS